LPYSTAPATICILRLSALGDVCNAVAAIQTIQTRWPDCQITWVCGALEAQFLKLIPNIEIITYNKKGGKKALFKLRQQLKTRRFDYLLHMQSALRSSMVSMLIPAKVKLGFDKQRANDLQWLFTNKKIEPAKTAHVLDGFMQFAAYFDCQDLNPHWNINIPQEDKDWAQQQIGNKTLLICPAASKAYKNWTATGYVGLIKHAMQRGYAPILIGGPSPVEITLAEQIIDLLDEPISNLVGKTSLPQLIALIQAAKLLVSPDTGPAHLAVAVGTPVIGLYAHHNPKRTGPYHYLPYVVSAYESAIQAQTGKSAEQQSWRSRVKDIDAMKRISVDQVNNKFDAVITELAL